MLAILIFTFFLLLVSVLCDDYGVVMHFSCTKEAKSLFLRHVVSLEGGDWQQILACLSGYPFATVSAFCVPSNYSEERRDLPLGYS